MLAADAMSSQKTFVSDQIRFCPVNTLSVILCKYGSWTWRRVAEIQSLFHIIGVFLAQGPEDRCVAPALVCVLCVRPKPT
jgi:hypothetical protein